MKNRARLKTPPSQRRSPATNLSWQERIRRASIIITDGMWSSGSYEPNALYEKIMGLARKALSDEPTGDMIRDAPGSPKDYRLDASGVFRVALDGHGWRHDPAGSESIMVIIQRTVRERIDQRERGYALVDFV